MTSLICLTTDVIDDRATVTSSIVVVVVVVVVPVVVVVGWSAEQHSSSSYTYRQTDRPSIYKHILSHTQRHIHTDTQYTKT